MGIQDLLLKAVEAERANRLDQAAEFYAAVVQYSPENFDGLHGQGVICYRKGDLSGAESWIRRALSVVPQSAMAHNNLGTVYFSSGRLELAMESYRTALSITPNFVDARSNLAAALTQLGHLPEARKHYEAILRTAPDHADANNNLGAVLQRMGLDGVAYFERAVQLRPDFPDALINWGTALLSRENAEQAIELLRRAVRLRPDRADAHHLIGVALAHREQYDEALEHYRAAIALRPNLAEAHNNLGSAADAIGDPEAAIASYKTAAELAPDYADPHGNLAAIHTRFGRLDEARRELEIATRLSPLDPKFLIELAGLKDFEPSDPLIETMEGMLARTSMLDENARIGLHFALSKAYDDLNHYDRAAEHMEKGNGLKRQQITYDESAALGELLRIQQIFSAEFMESLANSGNLTDVPIFIVGMPRSGTTLIEQVLASQGQVFGAGELSFFEDSVLGLAQTMGTSLRYPDYLREMDKACVTKLADDYLRATMAVAPSASRIADKLLSNFRFVGLIHLAFPNARIIHACRDPMDSCFSCYSILFAHGQSFTYDLRELGRLYNAYWSLMRYWHRVLPSGVMIDVHYERLVADFENEARRLLAHCNLQWSEKCLSFHKTHRAVRTASATQIRKPLYSTSVQRWRPYEKMLQPLLEQLSPLPRYEQVSFQER
jgi:tetratricopeptide (TPR) repeat protein